ncbi:phosphoribosylformylglycinamidine cyclo-ligase, partial [Candidatus Gottesmanbacteria bacterium]|nr:phosphoribosylformylglycinamidine cyclo-ligase [Candidatus Gottesmanbacteria bacterium]
IRPKSRLILGDKVRLGDVIVFLESNGIQANGLSLVRKLVKKIKGGYKEKLSSGKMFGEELLKPTHIYSKFVTELIDSGVDIHYMVNITGHGWRKLMRLNKSLSYIIEALPKVSPLFSFIREKAKLSDKEMYATFNMGVGFALYLNDKYAAKIFSSSKKYGFRAWVGGYIGKGSRQVVIKPINITYSSQELSIR